jgi:hypothetical protein
VLHSYWLCIAATGLHFAAKHAGAAQQVQCAQQDMSRSTHLLQVSSCCAHGATARELTE